MKNSISLIVIRSRRVIFNCFSIMETNNRLDYRLGSAHGLFTDVLATMTSTVGPTKKMNDWDSVYNFANRDDLPKRSRRSMEIERFTAATCLRKMAYDNGNFDIRNVINNRVPPIVGPRQLTNRYYRSNFPYRSRQARPLCSFVARSTPKTEPPRNATRISEVYSIVRILCNVIARILFT